MKASRSWFQAEAKWTVMIPLAIFTFGVLAALTIALLNYLGR